jgi:hypothetical protein
MMVHRIQKWAKWQVSVSEESAEESAEVGRFVVCSLGTYSPVVTEGANHDVGLVQRG